MTKKLRGTQATKKKKGGKMETIIYKLELEEDDDYNIIDYSVFEINPQDYDDPPCVDGKAYFATEEAAIAFARGELADLEKCGQCGEMHLADKPNPCLCIICGYPVSDGHWHPSMR